MTELYPTNVRELRKLTSEEWDELLTRVEGMTLGPRKLVKISSVIDENRYKDSHPGRKGHFINGVRLNVLVSDALSEGFTAKQITEKYGCTRQYVSLVKHQLR